ncbi:MAG: DUF4321 domain-containing protein [Ruminococcus sp.]|jgi:hypothetical protein|nr:DUF4321 domain-containing protein [Ruminococcus sp.]
MRTCYKTYFKIQELKIMKKTFVFAILLLAAVILGALMGASCRDIEPLAWLAYSKGFSLDSLRIDLSILSIDFGCALKVNVAQLILILVALCVYPKAAKAIGD